MNMHTTFDAGLLVGENSLSVKEYFYMKGFKQKASVFFENTNFIVKTAANKEEVLKAIKLRTRVFLDELGGLNPLGDVDIDEYDIYSDHLLLIDKKTGNVVGTYRFNSNLFSNSFYSEQEFNIYNILSLPGIKLELGRACIDKEYRGGGILSLLWTGLMLYIKKIKADYLFGCSSVNVQDVKQAARVYTFFKEMNHLTGEDLRVIPRSKYKVQDLDLFMMDVEKTGKKEYLFSRKYVPGLVKGYLSAGSKICGEPIYDSEFKCYDFFTFLDLKKLNQDYVKRVTLLK